MDCGPVASSFVNFNRQLTLSCCYDGGGHVTLQPIAVLESRLADLELMLTELGAVGLSW